MDLYVKHVLYFSLSNRLARLLKHSHQHVKLCFCSLSLICNSLFIRRTVFGWGLCYVSRRHGGCAVIFTLAAFPFFFDIIDYTMPRPIRTHGAAGTRLNFVRSCFGVGPTCRQAGVRGFGVHSQVVSPFFLRTYHDPTRTPHTCTTISLALHTHSHLTHIIPRFPHTHHVFCGQATRKHHAYTLKPAVYHVTSHTQRAHNTRPPFTPFHSRPKLINIPPVTPVIPP